MDPLQEELLKLTELAPNPPDLSFLLGYLCALPRDAAAVLRPAARQLVAHLDDGLITGLNVLEILAVIRLRVLPGAKRGQEGGRAAAEMETLAGELICDNTYLQARYFNVRPPKEDPEESLGVECAICTVEIHPREVCYLSCAHMYHRACFEGYSKEKISTKAFPLRCPAEECSV
jgi:hypothetical protein